MARAGLTLGWIIAALLGLGWAAESGRAEMTYYVSACGDDGNPGAIESPWRTVQKAADTLKAGDTVYLREGIYPGQVVPAHSGAPGQYITFAAYPGESATIDGEGVELKRGDGLFAVAGREYIRVLGLRVVNSSATGIISRESRHIVIERCYTHDTANSGIGVWRSSEILVKGNEVVYAVHGGSQECITIAGSDHVQVLGNHVRDGGPGNHGGEGIDAKDGCSYVLIQGNHVHDTRRLGIYVDAWKSHQHHIDVVGNLCHDCDGCGFAAASERGGLLEKVRFVNNVARHNRAAGIAVAGWDGGYSHPIHDLEIINNTVCNNGWPESTWGGGIVVESPEAERILIRNNICAANRDWQIRDQVGGGKVAIDHNLIEGFRGAEHELCGTDSIEGDPLFVAAEAGDFRLRAGSPAIDAGAEEGAPDSDFGANPRPVGAAPDIGALEYAGKPAESDLADAAD